MAQGRFSEAPVFFRLSQGGDALWEGRDLEGHALERAIELRIEQGHVEIMVVARWAAEGSHVFELILIPDALEERALHAWGNREIDELFDFHWHGEDDH